jgi:transglutaminase-like putative cysteine protease
MRASPLFVLALAVTLQGQEAPRVFRQWFGGVECGGASQESKEDGGGREVRARVWMSLTRLGQEIRQEVHETTRKSPGGSLTFTWRVQLSAEPLEGKGAWSPREPGILRLQPTHGPALKKEVPPGALLWPEDLEAAQKAAAREFRPIKTLTFSFPLQQWSTRSMTPMGADPLPGFPDAVRYSGEEQEGPLNLPVEIWISPTAGEVRHRTEMGGLEVITQRAELPAPAAANPGQPGFFERTLKRLPPHPFQPWLPALVLQSEGAQPALPEDAQQSRLPSGRWQLRRAALPTPAEASQPPLVGTPPPDLARYLAPSPLVQFQDPAFAGLLRRMALPPALSRWELARRVTTFVFDWITDKDYTVGFASALEVCHTPRGDCTEHGVLAVALLRKLGVPARGVTGWVALGDVLGLHFWVEVRLGDRWVPVDPTFDQAPASAFRIKVGDTDLADMGSVLWVGAAADLARLAWKPVEAADIQIQGDRVIGPGGLQLRLPQGRWEFHRGILDLRRGRSGPWRVQAVIRPQQAQLKGARRMSGSTASRTGWWQAEARVLWMELSPGRWLQVDGISEGEAFDLLDQLTAPTSSS